MLGDTSSVSPHTSIRASDRRNASELSFRRVCLQKRARIRHLGDFEIIWQPLLRFADPSRPSILIPNRAGAARAGWRTGWSLRWSVVGKFYDARVRDPLGRRV